MEDAIARWVRPDEVLEVNEGVERLWPNKAAIKRVNDERNDKVRKVAESVFWAVGINEVPSSYPKG